MLWEYDWLGDDHATDRSESPPGIRVTVEATMSVTVDDACDVTSVSDERDD